MWLKKLSVSYYIVGFPKLVQMINENAVERHPGLPDLYEGGSTSGRLIPKSNSGMMFAGLLGERWQR